MSIQLPSGYQLRMSSGLERSLLVKFVQLTYQELFPEHNFTHLALTVDRLFSPETPLWWVEVSPPNLTKSPTRHSPVGCLWLGNAIDQVIGDRYAYIFLLYVVPHCRQQGIGKALMRQAEDWAMARGDRQLGLQVFPHNQPALNLYSRLGYQTQSLWMVKPLLR